MKTPEHEKLSQVKDLSQEIGSFLDWIQSQGMCLAKFNEGEEHYWPVNKRIEQILAEYFEIDLNKLEKEKIEMIEEMRNARCKRA